MNFVETAPVIAPRIAVEPEAIEARAATPSKAKQFGVSMALTVVVFSFTLLGMITTTNFVTDEYVIPNMYGEQATSLRAPITTDTPADVETTLAE